MDESSDSPLMPVTFLFILQSSLLRCQEPQWPGAVHASGQPAGLFCGQKQIATRYHGWGRPAPSTTWWVVWELRFGSLGSSLCWGWALWCVDIEIVSYCLNCHLVGMSYPTMDPWWILLEQVNYFSSVLSPGIQWPHKCCNLMKGYNPSAAHCLHLLLLVRIGF